MSKSRTVFLSLAAVIGLLAVIIATISLVDYYQTTHRGSDTPGPGTITSDNVESEKSVTVNDSYSVPASQPRVIRIPSLNVNAYVQRVGITKENAMATPNNINFAGWYVRNPAPGESGVSIINGHAGGRYTDGVFRHLNRLKPNDTVEIQMGDLSWRRFAVISSNVYPVAEASKNLFNDDASIDKELHLITCDGTFDDASQTYDSRAIIVAKYIE